MSYYRVIVGGQPVSGELLEHAEASDLAAQMNAEAGEREAYTDPIYTIEPVSDDAEADGVKHDGGDYQILPHSARQWVFPIAGKVRRRHRVDPSALAAE